MRTYIAAEQGIISGTDISKKLNGLIKILQQEEDEKTLVFEKGVYYLDCDNVAKPFLYITNTIGDDEWKLGEIPHQNAVGLYFYGIRDLTVDGNGSVFVMRGKMTNLVISECENVKIKNLTLTSENPDIHELKVIKKSIGCIEFELDSQSRYINEQGKFYFVGKGYKTSFIDCTRKTHWIGKVLSNSQDTLCRTKHPLFGTYSIKEVAPHRFRCKYYIKPNCKIGDVYYMFDVRRKHQGIFIERSKKVLLEGVEQGFNYGLATVFQDSEDIVVRKCRFAPTKDSVKRMSSVADFMQVCMCRGNIDIRENYFEGSGDDCLNVHGIHFPINTVEGNEITVKFMHRQSHGFCPFRKGDKLRFIDINTLLETDTNEVAQARLVDEFTVVITLKEKVSTTGRDIAVENATACPNITFAKNVITRVMTRGLLVTTSGKVLIEDNKFLNTSMHSILLSDDARHWYESGLVKDICIRNNYFGKCRGYTLMISPENEKFEGFVHKNVRFEKNVIDSGGQGGFYIKNSKDILISNNEIIGKTKKKIIKNSIVKE